MDVKIMLNPFKYLVVSDIFRTFALQLKTMAL